MAVLLLAGLAITDHHSHLNKSFLLLEDDLDQLVIVHVILLRRLRVEALTIGLLVVKVGSVIMVFRRGLESLIILPLLSWEDIIINGVVLWLVLSAQVTVVHELVLHEALHITLGSRYSLAVG